MVVPSRTVPLVVLLLCLLPLLGGAKRQPGHTKPEKPRHPPPPSAPPAKRSRQVHGSGELSTREGHRCAWQTSGDGLVSLLVNCTLGEQQRYWCRYAGKPDLCPAYGVKSSQYWKQLVGKLKKRLNACDGEKVLKAKTCKKAPAEAHMKLAQRGGPEPRRAGKDGAKRGGHVSRGPEAGRAEPKEEERTGTAAEGVMNDMAPAQSYCSEGWDSICSFFVKFFEG